MLKAREKNIFENYVSLNMVKKKSHEQKVVLCFMVLLLLIFSIIIIGSFAS